VLKYELVNVLVSAFLLAFTCLLLMNKSYHQPAPKKHAIWCYP